jgi:hypothetical protein
MVSETTIPQKEYYTTQEVCEISGLTQPRLSQLRRGQTISSSSNNKKYFIEPLLKESVDWFWSGGRKTMFTPLGLKKILERVRYNRRSKNGSNSSNVDGSIIDVRMGNLPVDDTPFNPSTMISAKDAAEQLGVSVQKLYSMRDMSTKSKNPQRPEAIKGIDWFFSGGGVYFTKDIVEKIKIWREDYDRPTPKNFKRKKLDETVENVESPVEIVSEEVEVSQDVE